MKCPRKNGTETTPDSRGCQAQGQSAHWRCVLNAALVPQSVQTTVDCERGAFAQVALEDFTVVTDLADDLDDPVLRQLQVFAVFTVATQQTSNVRVPGGLGFLDNVFRGDASFFSVEHGEQGPLHDAEPFFVAFTHDRTQWFLGNGFRQNNVVARGSQFAALCVQLRLVGSQHVATTRLQRLGAFVRGVESDRGVLQVVGTEVVGNVQLGGSTGLDTDGCTVQFLGTFHAQLVVGQEANAVVVSHAGEYQAHARITGAGPGGVTRQHVDFTRLQRSETLFGVQLAEFDFGGIAKNGSSDSTADVSIDTQDLAGFIWNGKTWQAVADAALDKTLFLDRVQSSACMSDPSHTKHCCSGHYSQGGFQHLHSNLQFALCCVGA